MRVSTSFLFPLALTTVAVYFSPTNKVATVSCGLCLDHPFQKEKEQVKEEPSYEKDFSKEWLCLFSFKEICSDLFKAPLLKPREVLPWEMLSPIELPLTAAKKDTRSMYWPEAQWDGSDFRTDEREKN